MEYYDYMMTEQQQTEMNEAQANFDNYMIGCIVGFLNMNNIDVNKAEKNGATPLYVALTNAHTDIAELLLNTFILFSLKEFNRFIL